VGITRYDTSDALAGASARAKLRSVIDAWRFAGLGAHARRT
jgi:hypothetical protein